MENLHKHIFVQPLFENGAELVASVIEPKYIIINYQPYRDFNFDSRWHIRSIPQSTKQIFIFLLSRKRCKHFHVKCCEYNITYGLWPSSLVSIIREEDRNEESH